MNVNYQVGPFHINFWTLILSRKVSTQSISFEACLFGMIYFFHDMVKPGAIEIKEIILR